MNDLKINEIFFSIQGESSLVGWPTVFIRTSGCPLRCTYCDTKYAYHEGQVMKLDQIISVVSSFASRHVCLTGGEPLIQKSSFNLLQKLCELNYIVSLETSGNYDCSEVDPRVRKIIDVKTPDSGASDSFCLENLKFAQDPNTEFKFVICSEKDFKWSENFINNSPLKEQSNVLYSPSFGKISENWLAKKILSEKSSARLQLQLHKYIWSPSERGV